MHEGKASHTAYTVLQGVVHTGQNARTKGLVSAEKMAACLSILNSTNEGRKRLRQLRNPLMSRALLLMQRLLLPGIAMHYVARKKAIEDVVRSCIENDVRQVVNIGAGFDTLMFELSHEYPALTFIELDHPQTAVQKQQALGTGAPENLHLHPVDLSQTSPCDVLQTMPAFDATADTCFVCEGVLMYLSRKDVERMFVALSQVTSGRMQFVFTATPSVESPNTNATWLLRRYLRHVGEPLQWTIEASEIKLFLETQDYVLRQIVDGHDLQRKYLSPMVKGPFHFGEFVVACAASRRA